MQYWVNTKDTVPANITTDVNVGLKYGCQELTGHLNKYPGDIKTAILAYRGGDGAVQQANGGSKKYYSAKTIAGMVKYQQKVYADFKRLSVRANPTLPQNHPGYQVPAPTLSDAQISQATSFSNFSPGLAPTVDAGTGKSTGVEVSDALDTNARAAAEAEEAGTKQSADIRSWDIDRASYDHHYGEDIFYAARRAEASGRLAQAFPSYLVLLVDGGSVFRIWRLSDIFYGLHSAMTISTFSSRKVAADTAVVTFADPYNNLSSIAADVALQKSSDTRFTFNTDNGPLTFDGTVNALGKGVQGYFYPAQEEADRRMQDLKSLLVKAGSRLHIRLGFGSDGSSLPTVFNGTISGVRRQNDVIEVTALGDGQELTNALSPNSSDQGMYVRNGSASSGENLRNIIASFFTDTQADLIAQQNGPFASAIDYAEKETNGYFLGGNPYGIVHFGSPNRNYQITDVGECGVNIYSGWSEAPVNVTYATEDIPLASAAFGIYKAVNEDIPQAIRQGADQLLGTYTGDGYAKSMDEAGLFRRFNSEPIVGLNMENATPWDIISTLRYVAVDYIRQVEPFGLRSTLFFGKSYWPLHYRYDFNEIAQARKEDMANEDSGAYDSGLLITDKSSTGIIPNIGVPTSGVARLTGTYNESRLYNSEIVYRRRPYLQLHLAHSGSNLLASVVEAQDETWCSIVQSMGTTTGFGKDAVESSYAQFLDVNIFPELQRQKVVKSGLYSTFGERLQDSIYTLGSTTPFMQTNILNNHAVGVLHDEVKEMYQGDIITTGNGWVRPFHLMHLDDAMKKMSGLVEVKEVMHSLTPDGGFITTVTPDCLANAADPSLPLLWGHCVTVASRLLIGNAVLKVGASSTGRFLIRRAISKALTSISKADAAFGDPIGRGAKLTEYNITSKFRRRFSSSKLGGVVSETTDKIYKVSGKLGPIDLSSIKDSMTQNARLRNEFANAIQDKESAGGVNKPNNAISNFEEFKRGRHIDEKLYKSIHSDIAERYYLSSISRLKSKPVIYAASPSEIAKQLATEEQARVDLRKQTDETVKRAIGRFNPIDDEGNLIEEDRMLERFSSMVDPYHGYGSIWGDLKESARQRRVLKWASNTPKGQARVDSLVLAQLKDLGISEEIKKELDKAFKDQKKSSDELAEILHQYTTSTADLKIAIEDQLAAKERDLKYSKLKLKAARKPSDIAALKAEVAKSEGVVALLKKNVLKITGLAEGTEAADKASALAHYTLVDERAGKLIRNVFSVYGRFVPTEQAKLDVAIDKTISGISKGTQAAEEAAKAVKAARNGEQVAKGVGFVAKVGVVCRPADCTCKSRYYISNRRPLYSARPLPHFQARFNCNSINELRP